MIDITCAFLKGGSIHDQQLILKVLINLLGAKPLIGGTPQPILGDLGDPLLENASFLGNGRPAIKGISV